MCRVVIAQILGECIEAAAPVFARTAQDAYEQIATARPELVLVDLFTIDYRFDELRRLLSHPELAAAIVIDDRVNTSVARLAKDAGARGYASKNFELSRFRSTVRAVIEGGTSFPQDVPASQTRTRLITPAAGLSRRQLDVLRLMALGKTNREIAELLGITSGTVKLHTHSVLKLTGARNRTEATLLSGRFLTPTIG